MMLPILFLASVLLWILVLAAVLRRHASARAAKLLLLGAVPWTAYFLALGASGVLVRHADKPLLPLVLVPVLGLIAWATFSRGAGALAERVPVRLLVGLQAFRIGVELFLHQVHLEGMLPEDMTYLGRNFDVLTGLTALVVLFLPAAKRWRGALLAWNLAGLALLVNVVGTGILSAPGPLQRMNQDMPNLAIVTFPYILVAAVFVASAAVLHALALRRLLARRGGP